MGVTIVCTSCEFVESPAYRQGKGEELGPGCRGDGRLFIYLVTLDSYVGDICDWVLAKDKQFPTESLVALDSCRPVSSSVHQGKWAEVVSPLIPSAWERGLREYPDRVFAEYVIAGICQGFRVGFDYHRHKCGKSRGNMKSVEEHKEVVQEYIQGELDKGRLLGPFQSREVPAIHISPFGVIPKSEPGKWRLIVDLSSPCGGSVNDGISKEWCSLSYLFVDEVAAQVRRYGRGAMMAKFDLKAAYRNVPVHPDDRHLLGMGLQQQVFVDMALPFGLRSAPMIFSAVAEALAYLIRKKGVPWLDHYLDDFIMVGPPESGECGQGLRLALETCKEVGFPVSDQKTVGPVTVITILGIEVDSVRCELRLPQDKLAKLKVLLKAWRRRKVCTKRELQSLAGHLSHACKVVRPGRRFLRGVFELISQFRRRDHKIRLNTAIRADVEWWWLFVGSWNGVSMFWKSSLSSPDVEFWSDASGLWGCGAVWETHWFQVRWSDWPGFGVASIAAKELLPIIVAVAVWGHGWVGQAVRCHCDNQAVVAAIKGGYCKDPAMAHMLRCLFFLEASFNISLSAVHVPGVDNGAADSVSRNQLERFFSLCPQARREATEIPGDLVGGLVIQEPWTSPIWRHWLDSLSTLRLLHPPNGHTSQANVDT